MAWTFHLSADGYPTTSDTDKRPRFFRVCLFVVYLYSPISAFAKAISAKNARKRDWSFLY